MGKTAALRIRIEPELHKKFLDTCKARDVPASQVLREFMKQYVSDHERTPQLDFFQPARSSHVD
jgi:antitoxin component of RelBE/YafQ-DinJ toxin-antitoxin module